MTTKFDLTTEWVAFLKSVPNLTPSQMLLVARYSPPISAQVDWIWGKLENATPTKADQIAAWETIMSVLPSTDILLTPDQVRALVPTTPDSISLGDFMTSPYQEIGKYFLAYWKLKLVDALNAKMTELKALP